MSYILYDYKIIEMIESIKNVELTLHQAHLFSIINSYNRKGQKCHESLNSFARQIKMSKKRVILRIKELEDMKLISVYRPKNKAKQKAQHIANTYYVHEDLRDLLKDILEEASPSGGLGASPGASPSGGPYNKNRDSQSPFRGDCSSYETDAALQAFYNELNKNT